MIDISKFQPADLKSVLEITVRAWAPVFPMMQEDIPSYVYNAFYPDGWKERQLTDVEAMCKDDQTALWVARDSGVVAGYLGLREHPEDSMGEIYIIAVDPQYQRNGIGQALMTFAFDWMQKRRLKMAFVETGGDRGHAPARASYERAGFERYPVARYFKKL